MEPAEVYQKLEAAHADDIDGVDLVAHEGLRLTPAPPHSNEQLEQLVLPILDEVGWIVTSLRRGVLIEPRYTKVVTLPEGLDLFHVSERGRREGIEANGLTLGTGGNTRLARKYPPRVFLALGREAAEQFITFQCNDTRMVFRNGRPARADPVRERAEFDIWHVNPDGALALYTDILFPGQAAWTETPFLRDRIALVQ